MGQSLRVKGKSAEEGSKRKSHQGRVAPLPFPPPPPSPPQKPEASGESDGNFPARPESLNPTWLKVLEMDENRTRFVRLSAGGDGGGNGGGEGDGEGGDGGAPPGACGGRGGGAGRGGGDGGRGGGGRGGGSDGVSGCTACWQPAGCGK